MATVFVSYNKSDSGWAHRIKALLTSLGHKPLVHEGEVGSGGNIWKWMEKSLASADRFLCVVSPAYADGDYATDERHAAHQLAKKKPDGYFLVVVVKECDVPPFLTSFKRCDLYGLSDDAANHELEKYLKAIGPSSTTSGAIAPIINLPRPATRHFMGRDTEMSRIEELLKQRSDRLAAVALVGMPGAGKSTLAIKYADSHRSDYRAQWWIRSETDQGIRGDLMGLGTRLGWVRPADGEDVPVSVVLERLAHEGDGILLIYDNSRGQDALGDFLPRDGKAHVLVTSNAKPWDRVAEEIDVKRWPTNVGAAYLLARTAAPASAEALTEALGGLPLALEVAASYCKQTGVSLAAFQRTFEAEPLAQFDERVLPLEFQNRQTVPTAFALILDATSHPGARPLIEHAALLAPQPIPLSLFEAGQEALEDSLRSVVRNGQLNAAIGALRAFSLIDRELILDERDATIQTDSLRLHPLLRAFVGAQLKTEKRTAILRSLIGAMAVAYPQDDPYVMSRWPAVRRLDAHAFALVGEGVEPPPGAELAAAELMNRLGAYRQASATDYVQARKLFERALKIRTTNLGGDHPKVAESLNSLALLSWTEEDLSTARSLCERALAIREKALGPHHPDVATSLINMARITRNEDPAVARSSLTRALSILEVTSPEHADVGTALTILGRVLMAEGDLRAAAENFRRARSLFEGAFGPEHPAVASTLESMAMVLGKEGKIAEARQLLERALAINEKAMGAEHPTVAGALMALASVLQEERRFKEARPLVKKAVRILERACGPAHVRTEAARKQLRELIEQGA